MKKYTKSLSILLAAGALTISGCQNGDQDAANQTDADTNQTEEAVEDNEDSLSYPQLEDGVSEEEVEVVMETNMGDIHLKLFPEYAPLAVENFITLSEEGYYEDVIFHRIIENFMIQGGDPTGTGMGGESAFGESFEDEITPELAHFRGALSMANSGPNTNGSQFFIVHAGPEELMAEMFEGSGFPEETVEHYLEYGGTPHLDGGHTVFGHVIDGMDIVDAIATVETEGPNNSTPVEDVYIETVRILD